MERPARRRQETPPAKTSRVVAVVGSQSFLGVRLCARLLEDPTIERVVAIDIRPPETTSKKLVFACVDLTRPSADQELAQILEEEGACSLVHLAFLANPIANASYAHELEAIGTLHVVTAAAAARIERLVMQSTTAVYGAHPKNPNLLTEDRLPVQPPASRFLADKLEAEKQVLRFATDHPAARVVVLRLGPVIGPTVDNLFSRYLTHRLAASILGFDPLVQALHEDDAVAAFHHALVHTSAQGIYNVVADGVVPLSTALRLCGTRAIPLPHSVASAVLNLLRSVGAGLTPASLLDLVRYLWVADGTRMKRDLAFVPLHTTRDAIVSLTARAT